MRRPIKVKALATGIPLRKAAMSASAASRRPFPAWIVADEGGVGHTRALLEAAPDVQVVAFDRDPAAGERAAGLAEEFADCFTLVDQDFGTLAESSLEGFDGILFDLGVSSFQLDASDRGFSFR